MSNIYDAISKGAMPIPAHAVSERQHLTSLPLSQLVQLVLDPELSERPNADAIDPRYKRYAEIRASVQRLIEGSKRKNAGKFAEYLHRGMQGGDFITPPIILFHERKLDVLQPEGQVGCLLLVPAGDWLVAIDGETQRIAWGRVITALDEQQQAQRIPVVIHHGRTLDWARQAFHDLNVFGVRPNAAIGISMDNRDYATRITRQLIAQSGLLKDRVEMRRRQLRSKDESLVTISGLRNLVVTTMLGSAGFQVGAKPVPSLPSHVDPDELEGEVIQTLCDVLDQLAPAFVDDDETRRLDTLVASPAFLAGLGVVIHRAIDAWYGDGEDNDGRLTVEELFELLEDVVWEREVQLKAGRALPWLGVGGKLSPKGKFSVGSPKEYGYQIADALLDPSSPAGRQIRGRDYSACTAPKDVASVINA